VGPSELDRLPELLQGAFNGEKQIALSGHTSRRSRTLDAAMDRLEALDRGRLVDPDEASKQAYVRITRGCNKFCSFCVVPYTRGPEVHREPDAIVAEVRKLVDAGAQEVTLLGQTINHYHHGDTSFAKLLARVHDEVPNLPRLRFLTSFPRDFTDEALDVMASRERICKFLHIPAQSGSDKMLARMNRGYTVEQYMSLIARAKKVMPDVAIVGDMIVGYPGETDEDFEASLQLLRDVRYKTVYVFKYSPRPGTVAAVKYEDDVADDVKRERNQRMLKVQQEISLEHHQQMIGRAIEVLVEGTAKLDPELVSLGKKKARLTSRTRGDHIVAFDGDPALIGSLVKVNITRASALSLQGQLV
jgi:tRNA-2-methylthio-N6-dimethylallyladenosine synthase